MSAFIDQDFGRKAQGADFAKPQERPTTVATGLNSTGKSTLPQFLLLDLQVDGPLQPFVGPWLLQHYFLG